MKEQFLLAPGASGTELLRSLAKQGRNTLGLRVVSALELAKDALMKSGISITQDFLTRGEEPSVIFSFINSITYFKAASYKDAENMAAALTIARNMIPVDESSKMKEHLANGEFPEKNQAVLSAYEKYMELCSRENRIDSVGIIRRAISEAKPMEVEIITLKEYPLTVLEQALASQLSGGKTRELSLPELFGRELKDYNNIEFTDSYGAINEAEGILTEIIESKTPLDSCTIACASSEYPQIFFNLAQVYDIPVTFGTGLPITNSNPATLLKLVHNWQVYGYNGVDAVRRILNSEAFNRQALKELFGLGETEYLGSKDYENLAVMCGNLRLGFDKSVNDERLAAYKAVLDADPDTKPEVLTCFERVELLAREFEKGYLSFLGKFALIRYDLMGALDRAALSVIAEKLTSYQKYAGADTVSSIIPEILTATICAESSKEGHLHITSISGALATVRNNLYVCGLSGAEFPGNPKENYLLLDNDMLLFADAKFAPVSSNLINKKKETYDNLLSLAMALDINVKLSFSSFNLSTNKDVNPSSVLFATYEKQYPGKSIDDFKRGLKSYEYFKGKLSASRLLGKSYSAGETVKPNPVIIDKPAPVNPLDRAWSPSALEIFFKCPRHFYLKYILGIDEIEEDNPFEVLSAAEIGDVAHLLMKELGSNPGLSKKDFLALVSKHFDEALTARPPLSSLAANDAKEEFLEMMEQAYDMDPKDRVISAEKEYVATHPCGVKLHGYIDRVVETSDGVNKVIDFKTKRKLEHNGDDIDKCLQVMIYIWLCNQNSVPATEGEYWYFRLEKKVPCEYDSNMEAQLEEKLNAFKQALENNTFKREENDDNCKYCKLSSICNYEDKKVEEDNKDA